MVQAMNCPNCRTENPEGARFCMNCGRALLRACPHCGVTLPATARFCSNCGQPQEPTDQAAAPTPASESPEALLQRFIPQELLAKLEAARGRQGLRDGERRIVTMLFCDVKGSTAAAGRLDPEEWAEIINGAFECMIRPVYRYEGTVARLMGDGILAFFGAPIAHEDDPQRAVLAGLEIAETVQPYRQTVGRRWGIDIDVRVGVNTGMVVVGAIGSDLRLEYTAVGDAINLAARMEQTAEPGTVQISADTHRLIAPLFDFVDLGDVQVKGKEEPVRAYRVVGPRQQPGRLRGIAGLEAPLVGRDRELNALAERLEMLNRGKGGVVFIVGEAGLGKSRLIGEARSLTESRASPPKRAFAWYESSSLSYETMQPYGLFQRLLRRICGVTAKDTPEAIRESLSRLLTSLYDVEENGTPAATNRRLFDVFDRLLTGETSSGREQPEGEAYRRELTDGAGALLQRLGAERPLVVVLDDLHWADAASMEMLRAILEPVGPAPLLFICATRPDAQTPAWAVRDQAAERGDRFTEIILRPLAEADSNALIHRLLREIALPGPLQARIYDKAGGNPFFVEEVVRTLIERGLVVRDEQGNWTATNAAAEIELPDTLQGLLLARIDRLAEGTRRTLQIASVIGRSFYYQVLQLLAEAEAELDRHLGTLTQADLIREAARLPELEYAFTHALTQEAAYNSILLKRRRAFHRRVGEALETFFPQRLDEMSAALAHHFRSAGDERRAARYYTAAGDLAFRLYANTEAADHYRRALALSLDDEATDPAAIRHLFRSLGRALELIAEYEEALQVYERMSRWAREQGDPATDLDSLLRRATIRTTANALHDPGEGRRLLEEAQALAHLVGDAAAEARILWNLLLLTSFSDNDPAIGRDYGEQALAISRAGDHKELTAFILFDLWYAYGGLGDWDQAVERLLEARGLWQELDNLPLLAETYTRLHYSTLFMGDYEQSLAYAEEANRLSRLSNNIESQAISLSAVGHIYLDRGELQRGLNLMCEALALGEQAQVVLALVGTRTDLGWAYGWLGDPARGIALAEAADRWITALIPHVRAWALGPLARLLIQTGELERAEAILGETGPYRTRMRRLGGLISVWVTVGLAQIELALARGHPDEALAVAEALRSDMQQRRLRFLSPDVMLRQAEALLALGRTEEAGRALRAAERTARELNVRRVLWSILDCLGEVAQRSGTIAAAEEYRRQAWEIARSLADNLDEPELRATFLSRPDVARLAAGRTQ